MLSRYFRIKKKSEFDRAKKQGKLIQRSLYATCIHQRGDVATPRFGFIISKKISKLAVQRNRIKRALEHAVQYNLKYVPIGIDMIFLVKSAAASASSDEIMHDVEKFLRNMDTNENEK